MIFAKRRIRPRRAEARETDAVARAHLEDVLRGRDEVRGVESVEQKRDASGDDRREIYHAPPARSRTHRAGACSAAKPWWRGFTRVAERDPRSRPSARADLVHETFVVKGDRSRIQATPSTNARALRYAPPRPRVIGGRKCHCSPSRRGGRIGARVERGAKGKTRVTDSDASSLTDPIESSIDQTPIKESVSSFPNSQARRDLVRRLA